MGEYPILNGCPDCEEKVGVVKRNGPHTELRCKNCNKHIKFIPKAAAKKQFADGGVFDAKENKSPEVVLLETISFQLDVIMAHFDMCQKTKAKHNESSGC